MHVLSYSEVRQYLLMPNSRAISKRVSQTTGLVSRICFSLPIASACIRGWVTAADGTIKKQKEIWSASIFVKEFLSCRLWSFISELNNKIIKICIPVIFAHLSVGTNSDSTCRLSYSFSYGWQFWFEVPVCLRGACARSSLSNSSLSLSLYTLHTHTLSLSLFHKDTAAPSHTSLSLSHTHTRTHRDSL